MRTSRVVFLITVLLFGLVATVPAQDFQGQAVPYPKSDAPAAIDRGELTAQSKQESISVTILLPLHGAADAEDLLQAQNTPGDPQFHKFLTAGQFVAQFAPSDAEIAAVVARLAKYGLATQKTSATTLKVTGMPAQFEQAFSVSLHKYEVPAQGKIPGYTYHAPLGQATVPTELSGRLAAIVGLDSRPKFRPNSRAAHPALARLQPGSVSAATGNPPGLWTVKDFASYYDVNPLYNRGLTGKGRTLAIVTLASFTPSDAFAYWQALGLSVDPYRIEVVNVDGGPGAPSDASGSQETTLDVEQSGGVAPGAKIIVYQAPNQDQAWVDAFAAAVECNTAESISTSWGNWEWFFAAGNNPVTDPTSGKTVDAIQAFHELFLRAAVQGQTIFAASLDDGAFIGNGILNCYPSTTPSCSNFLSVDYPASDPAIVGTGATTLAGTQTFCLNSSCSETYSVNVPHERVWGWDYLLGLCATLGYDPLSCGIYPVGSGGGVSVLLPTPPYQSLTWGVQLSQPHQDFVYNGQLVYALPAYYRGRNVPDISTNGDPDTGYVIYYTSSVNGPEILTYWGGTSFVAPQLNGVTALLGEDFHSRLGLLNDPLYSLAAGGKGYSGPDAPLHAIKYGDNWFYHGSDGYNPAVGLGTLDVAKFAEYLLCLK